MVVVGRLGAAHGIKGWNRLQSFTAEPGDIADYKEWYLRASDKEEWRKLNWDSVRWQGKRLVVKLAGCEDRTAAEAFTGWEIAVKGNDLPVLDEEEFYWHQLLGLTVVTEWNGNQLVLGELVNLMETGANDVLVVQGKPCAEAVDERERLIPYVDQVVQQVDLSARKVTVIWDPEF